MRRTYSPTPENDEDFQQPMALRLMTISRDKRHRKDVVMQTCKHDAVNELNRIMRDRDRYISGEESTRLYSPLDLIPTENLSEDEIEREQTLASLWPHITELQQRFPTRMYGLDGNEAITSHKPELCRAAD